MYTMVFFYVPIDIIFHEQQKFQKAVNLFKFTDNSGIDFFVNLKINS